MKDVRRTLTPALLMDERPTSLWLIDLGGGRNRLGGSALAQVYGELGDVPPDLDDPRRLLNLTAALSELRAANLLLAYHDRSDGGLFATLLEMAFAGGCGLYVALPAAAGSAPAQLFSEELGVVVQVMAADEPRFADILAKHDLAKAALYLGAPTSDMRVQMKIGTVELDESWVDLRRAWSETSWRMRRLRDDPLCADEEYAAQTNANDPGLSVDLSFDPEADIAAPYIASGARPAVAILREEGVTSNTETAAMFDRAGFTPHDVHMTDLLSGRRSLEEFKGLVACGGFSYGDVLERGRGGRSRFCSTKQCARSSNSSSRGPIPSRSASATAARCSRRCRASFRGRSIGPRFVRNRSEQYESRFTLVEILRSPSVVLDGMAGSFLPIAVAHGEGYAEFASPAAAEACAKSGLVSYRFVDNARSVATNYPLNPNGSPFGIAALTNTDGRVTITMPHPERSARYVQNSWHPREVGEHSGWTRLFRNARKFVG